MESLLLQASIYLGAAVVIVPLAIRLGLGSVLGYLAAGILVGPVLGLAGAEAADLQHFAEFGVVLMLFLIGLELEPRTLWDMRHRLLGLGGAQVVLTAAAIGGALYALGAGVQLAVTMGMVLSLSSTAIVLQTMTEKNLMRTAGGRSSFSVLLTQDIAVVPMLALIPLLSLGTDAPTGIDKQAEGASEVAAEATQHMMNLLEGLNGWQLTIVTLAVVASIILVGSFLTRPVFRFVHASRLPEMSTFISLLIVLGIAFLMSILGLSPALGTFIAGVVLASSEFRHQLEADLKPFKGLLLGLFFMTVGVGIDTQTLISEPITVIALTIALMTIKALVLLILTLPFGLTGRDRMFFTLGLAQAGEFGFLLVSFAQSQSILQSADARVALLVISLSMLVTPALFLLADYLGRVMHKEAEQKADEIDEKGRVIIAGIGRFGQVVNRLLRMSGLTTVVLDADAGTIETMRRFGVKGFFGDPSRPELLHAAGLMEASVLVVAVDSRDNATKIVKLARTARPDLHIVARARDRVHVYELYQAGANDIVRETFDSSIRAGRYVLENMGFTDYEAAKLSQTYFHVDRGAMRDLASLWVPGQPVHLNAAYVARAKQLDADLETALIEGLDAARNEPSPLLSPHAEGPASAEEEAEPAVSRPA